MTFNNVNQMQFNMVNSFFDGNAQALNYDDGTGGGRGVDDGTGGGRPGTGGGR